jgi:nucleotide-binding universal stress UspA family protein
MNAQRILHPTDGSKAARKALEYAAQLAVSTKAKLILLHVQGRRGLERIPEGLEEYERIENIRMTEADILRDAAEAVAAGTENAARAMGAEDVEKVVTEGDPTHEIIAVAKALQVDTIVMGSRGLGDLQGLLLGSVSHKVAQMAPCTCIIVR